MARNVAGPAPGEVREYTPAAFNNREDPEPIRVWIKNPTEKDRRFIEAETDALRPLMDIQGKTLLLREGELSEWVRIEFPMLGAIYNVGGICKFYIKSVHPHFSMYVSPINVDPGDPVLPISAPEKYARELVKEVGFFYTQGLPDDTKALSEGILTDAEYLKIAKQLLRERIDLLEYELKSFRRLRQGVLFFYVSSLDQNCHMAWRYFDKDSPIFDSDLHKRYGDTIKILYIEMDKLLGKVMAQYDIHDPDNILMIMSDHGFAPFRRQVNLNNWLYENGYLALETRRAMEDAQYFSNVRWDRTGAYNVGINSIYLNLEGREKFGLVLESQKNNLISNLKRELLDMIDPVTSEKMVTRVGIVSVEEKERHPHAPDIIVGWNTGYRNSWKSILGGFDREEVTDNLDKWSGDHCVDPDRVPAIMISNRNITKERTKEKREKKGNNSLVAYLPINSFIFWNPRSKALIFTLTTFSLPRKRMPSAFVKASLVKGKFGTAKRAPKRTTFCVRRSPASSASLKASITNTFEVNFFTMSKITSTSGYFAPFLELRLGGMILWLFMITKPSLGMIL